MSGIPLDDLLPPDYANYSPPDDLFVTGSPLFEAADAYSLIPETVTKEEHFAFLLGYEAAIFDTCLKSGRGPFCLKLHPRNHDRLVARAELFGRTVEVRDGYATVSGHQGAA